jgi:hypothetical protein
MLVLTLRGREPVARQIRGDYDVYRFSSLSAAFRHATWARNYAVCGDEDSARRALMDFESVYAELSV